ncbi:tyrosine-protein phosphatase non-receptor type 9-like [Tachypleus tridentatus]|uniref:tyrosine-protein phosphatase non-receptor type 9-like n=1 Tax=Tachypleus tridentatus TaxID=6853 RepID=UPI003FCF8328
MCSFYYSSGTGRTGIVLALDICMREFEECRTVDILHCVSRLRQDRDGAVQTKEQYFFLYEALNEYSCRFVNQSRGSSIMVYNV